MAELTRLLDENRRLRAHAHSASARASENNEGYLRRLGADLHDGPGQLISLALLRLDDDHSHGAPPGTPGEAGQPGAIVLPGGDNFCVRAVLIDALKEIRYLAAGLAVPEIDGYSLKEAIATVIARHRQITGTAVELDCGALPEFIGPAVKLCAYRFVQEGLSNAYRHADGIGQSVAVRWDGVAIVLTVADRGGGMPIAAYDKTDGLGIRGLTDRIESIGGSLRIETSPQHGTSLIARLPLATGVFDDA